MKIIYNVVEKRSNGVVYLTNPAESLDNALKDIFFQIGCYKSMYPDSKYQFNGNEFTLIDRKGERIITYKIIEEFAEDASAIGRQIPFCDYDIDWDWY